MVYTPQSREVEEMIMLMGELAHRTGLSKDTIRFYEKKGLIVASDRKAGTRVYKDFSPETVDQLILINRGKELGFTLKEIKQFIDELGSNLMSQEKQVQIIQYKLAEIDEKMQRLNEKKTYLATKLNKLTEI